MKTVEVKKELEAVASEMRNIVGCIEVLENSLYFAEERMDKDMTKPCAVAAEVILQMVEECQGNIERACAMLDGIKTEGA